MIKVSSPVAYGSGAYIAHKSLESGLCDYKVYPYNPYWALFPPAIRCFGDRSADIIHAPVDYAVFSRVKDKPLVATFHGYVLDRYMHDYVSTLHNIHYRTDLKWFILQALKKSDVITCVSKYLAGLIMEDLDYKGGIRIIYNGIDINKFKPTIIKKHHSDIKVLYCGGPGRRKGADLIPAILEKTHVNIKLVYTSGVKSDYRFIKHPKACWLGSVDYDFMPSLYNDVDVLLLPTVREGFGLAVAEAMACGLPVIATDCSSLPELIDNNKSGFLCTTGDVEMFAEKIKLLAQSPGLRQEMGEYNRQKVEQNFTLDRMAREYQLLFEEVLS